jgi:hypothetical protein
MQNADRETIKGFGDEWARCDQAALSQSELLNISSWLWNQRKRTTLPSMRAGRRRKAWNVATNAESRSSVEAKKRLWVVSRRVVFQTPSVGLNSGE